MIETLLLLVLGLLFTPLGWIVLLVIGAVIGSARASQGDRESP